MRKILWLLLLAAVCAFTSLHADITIFETDDGMAEGGSTLMVKASHARIDSPAGSMILDLESADIIRLMPSKRSYIKIPGAMAKAAFDAMNKQSPQPKPGAMSLKPTGKKDTISGYAADEYAYSGADGAKMTLWLSKAVPDYANLLKEMSADFAQGPMGAMLGGIFELDMAALPGFPIRTSKDSQPGPGQAFTSTVLSISAKPIADSEFAVPADYTQTPTPPFPGGAPPASQ